MSTPRTHRIRTLDHGTVTITCPAWCSGEHQQDVDRDDIFHSGPDHGIRFRGRFIADVSLVLSPFATAPRLKVFVSLLGQALDPAGLYELAALLDTHADQLRDLADQLATLTGGEPS